MSRHGTGVSQPGPPRGERFVARRRVEFRDTDAAGIAHFSAFFVWMESAEHELLRAAGVPLVEHVTIERQSDSPPDAVAGRNADRPGAAWPETLSWPRVSAACDYKAAIRFNDEIDIAVSLEAIGRSSVTWGFRFEHAGRWVAQGRVVAVRCRLRPGLPPTAVAIPVEILGRLAPYHDPTDAPAESDAIPSAPPEDPIGH